MNLDQTFHKAFHFFLNKIVSQVTRDLTAQHNVPILLTETNAKEFATAVLTYAICLGDVELSQLLLRVGTFDCYMYIKVVLYSAVNELNH